MTEPPSFIFDEWKLIKHSNGFELRGQSRITELNNDELNLLWTVIDQRKQVVPNSEVYRLLGKSPGRRETHDSQSSAVRKQLEKIRSVLDQDKSKYIRTERRQGIRWVYHEPPIESKGDCYDFDEKYDGYMAEIRSNLKRRSEAKDLSEWMHSKWKVALANVSVSREEKRDPDSKSLISYVRVDVRIPDDPFVAYNEKSRNFIEGHGRTDTPHPARTELQQFLDGTRPSVKNFPARFSAGGSLTYLRLPKESEYAKHGDDYTAYDTERDFEKFILVAQKTRTETIHKKHLRASSGLSEYPQTDWRNPKLVVITECFQKLKISPVENDKIRYMPDDNERFTSDATKQFEEEDFNDRIAMTIKHRREYLQNTDEGTEACEKATLIDLGSDEVYVEYLGEKGQPVKGLIALDPQFGAIDLMASIELTILRPLSGLKIYDDENHNPDFDRQPVMVFTPDEFKKVFRGEEAKIVRFFGFDSRHRWRDGDEAVLKARPKINPPLFFSGPALLRHLGENLKAREIFNQSEAVVPEIVFPG